MKENYRVHGFSKQQILSWSAFPCNLIKYRISSSRLPFTPRHKMFLIVLYLYTRYFSLIVSSWNWNLLLIVSSLPGFWKYNINKNDTSSLYGASAEAFVWNWASFQSKFFRRRRTGILFAERATKKLPLLSKDISDVTYCYEYANQRIIGWWKREFFCLTFSTFR